MPLERHKTIRQALDYVRKNPVPNKPLVEQEVWEIVARNIFETANNADTRVMGSLNRATRAQRIVMNYLTGTRRAGTHPAIRQEKQIEFHDLTQSETSEVPDEH